MDLRRRTETLVVAAVVAATVAMIGLRLFSHVNKALLERQLVAAVSRDDAAAVTELMDRGVVLHAGRKRPPTIMALACSVGAKHTVVALLRRGVRPGKEDVCTPALRGDAEMVDILMKAGANPNVMIHGGFPLIVSLAENRNFEMIKRLIKYGADPNSAYLISGYRPYGFTTLMTSVELKDVNSARELLDAGARVDMKVHDHISDLDGYTALMIAEKHKSAAAVDLLLKHGARRDTVASDGMTPIALAKENGEMLKMLTERTRVN